MENGNKGHEAHKEQEKKVLKKLISQENKKELSTENQP